MIQELEIRAKLAAFAEGAMPARDFYDWLDSNSVDMHRDSDPHAIELVGVIDHIFAEYDRHLFNEQRLRQKLISLANPYNAVDFEPVARVAAMPVRLVSYSGVDAIFASLQASF
jgi:hypothetical protein